MDFLKERFESNMPHHPELAWNEIQTRIENNPHKLMVLFQMENRW
jgi:hypothetical protein